MDTKQSSPFFPVELIENNGFSVSEIKLIESVVEENQEVIAEHWNRFFNKSN